MSTFKITSSLLNTSYTYEDTNVVINGNYQQDVKTSDLISISGTAYEPSAYGVGDYIGNFNGRMDGNEMKYTLSDMTRQDTLLVLNAIDEIEQYISGENQQ